MTTAFVVLSGLGLAFTANALFPRTRRSIFAVPSFFAAWPVSELAPQVIAIQLVGVAVFVAVGVLDDVAGLVALGICAVSWAGMGLMACRMASTGEIVERALADGLGAADAATPGGVVEHATSQRVLSVFRLALAVPIAGRDIEVVRDIRYAEGDGRRHLLDVYRPATQVRAAPVLLQIHGGAWIVGDKRQQARPLMHHLAAHGWICVAPNYRRSPRATFPDHLVDVKLALRWVRAHVAGYGGDPQFVVITGGSAGGHLAALTALTQNDREYQPGFEDADTSVSACVVFYGAYDLTGRFGGVGADGMGGLVERSVLKRRLADDPVAFSRASPIDQVHAGAPPFMVVHGSDDSLVPVEEGRAFATRLREVSSSPSLFLEVPHAQHAFEVFDTVRSEAVVRGVHRFLAFVRDEPRAQQAGSEPPGLAQSRECSG